MRGRQTATYVGADFLGGRGAALLWNLLTGLKRHLVALGVSHLCRISFKISEWRDKITHRGANVLCELVAVGTGLLPGRIVLIQDLGNIKNSHLHLVTGNFSHLFMITGRQVSRGSLEHTESFTCCQEV